LTFLYLERVVIDQELPTTDRKLKIWYERTHAG
jgi:hypothetical protein